MSVNIEALRFLIKLHYNVSFLSVKHYYERNGWQIIYFKESDKILEKIGLQDKGRREKGFIYIDENFKYIFIKKGLTEIEKRNVLFHEAGHIELKHWYIEISDEEAENQAKEFASVLLKQCVNYYKTNRFVIAIISVFIIVITILVHHYADSGTASSATSNTNIHYNQKAYTDYGVNFDEMYNENEYVFVTPSGHKYHLQDCFYIRYNNRAFAIDINSAKKSYLPCSYCMYDN